MIILLCQASVRLAGEVVQHDAVVFDELEFLSVTYLEHGCGRAAHEDDNVLQIHQSVQVVVVEVGVTSSVADEAASAITTESDSSS
jgi:hypothetical protein